MEGNDPIFNPTSAQSRFACKTMSAGAALCADSANIWMSSLAALEMAWIAASG
ncbi:hypothetical protein [Xanthomonas arboricola]|uniref:hypothetical protein n=1 Tax=Xanthomonas arboricola TaxID=56448 RepID=UPI001432040D|nr:hypothetical protein [Xanthomonas arboricola]NJB92439.1 hypothetical protein [Xanthomonas arboricola]